MQFAESGLAMWTCNACSFENVDDHVFCGMCSTTKPKPMQEGEVIDLVSSDDEETPAPTAKRAKLEQATRKPKKEPRYTALSRLSQAHCGSVQAPSALQGR